MRISGTPRAAHRPRTPGLLLGATILGTALASGLTSAAEAQAPVQVPAADADGASSDIIVTARRTEERLQDVPLSVSVLDGATVRAQGATSFRDIAALAPGFNYETLQPLVPQASIRGQTNLRTDSPVQNVSFFLDGVYLQRAYLVDQKLIELERLEVIRGPQSALYGRNAFAGAVNMVSRAPLLDRWAARLTGTIGTDERYEGRGWLSIPVVPDRIGLFVAGAYATFDGTWENSHPLANAPGAHTRGKIGGYENWMVQARLIARITATLTLDGLYVRTERDEETVPSYTVSSASLIYPFNTLNASPRPDLAPPFAVSNRLWVGPFPTTPVTAPQDTLRPPGIVIDPRAYGVRGPTDVVAARLSWEPGGPVTASYQFALLEAAVRGRGSPSPNPLRPVILPFPPFTNFGTVFDESGTDSSYRGFNNEIRFDFTGTDRWKGFVGFSWSKTKDIASNATSSAPANSLTEPNEAAYLFPIGPGLPFPTGFFQRTGYLERREDIWSAYGFLEIRLVPTVLLTLEGRFTIEDQLATDFLTREPTNPALQAFRPPKFQQSSNYFTPRVTASWQLAPDHLLYASAARGVKSGNLNGNVPFVPQRSYASETNWTYEIGSKNRWGGLTLNLAAFHTDWKNLQVTVVRLNADGSVPPLFQIVPSTVGNVGGVHVWGAEGELSWQVTPEFQLFAGGAWNRSRYRDGSVSQRFGASGNCDGIVCAPVPGVPTAVLPLGGNRLERVPEFDGVAGASFATSFSNGWSLRARAEVTHKGKQYMDEANLSFVRSRTLVNGALGVTAGPLDLSLWTRNLFDERYVSTSLVLIGTNGARSASYVPTFGERRTVGLTASVGF